MLHTSIPSPTEGVLWLGPLPIRAYALCILAGIIVATSIVGRRLEARGYSREAALNIAMWAVPFGIVGGRLYHVITTPEPYFGSGGHPMDAFAIWHGGLGIWGAVMLGAVGGWIGCRREGVPYMVLGDALAPALPLAQAMGRFGNYFNNELYGRATSLPWALKVYQWDDSRGHAVRNASGNPIVLGYFQPTFLYEAIWCVIIAIVVWRLSASGKLRVGQAFAIYVIMYPMGRIVFELMRSDFANRILGVRVNVWMCLLVFGFGVWLFFHRRNAPHDTVTNRPALNEENGSTKAADTVV